MNQPAETCPRSVAPPPSLRPATLASAPLASTLTMPLMLFFAGSVGAIVMNLSAAQPLTGPVSRALALPPELAGLIAMLPQLGYAGGLLLLVPLCDLLENRRLIFRTLACCAIFLALASFAHSGWLFLTSVFLAGATSSVIQMLVPM